MSDLRNFFWRRREPSLFKKYSHANVDKVGVLFRICRSQFANGTTLINKIKIKE